MGIFLNFSEVCFEIKYQIFKFKKNFKFFKNDECFLRIRSAVLKWRCNFMKCLSGKFFTTHKIQMQNDINSLIKITLCICLEIHLD
jgi:hypothetical protein